MSAKPSKRGTALRGSGTPRHRVKVYLTRCTDPSGRLARRLKLRADAKGKVAKVAAKIASDYTGMAFASADPYTVTVTLDQPGSARVTRALALLIDEINATPPAMPGDSRPITCHLAPRPAI